MMIHPRSSNFVETLQKKIEFTAPFLKQNKIKEVSESTIEFASNEDTTAKVIALKAPIVKIQALLSASKKLVIHTDLLIINGGYVTEPQNWDIQAKAVVLQNVNEDSLWIASLIQNQDGVKVINDANFKSQADIDCNFDIAPPAPLADHITEIKKDLKDLRDRLLNWR